MIGRQRQRAVEGGDRLIGAAEILEGAAAIDQRGEMVWLDRQDAVVAGDRVVELAEIMQRLALVEQGLTMTGSIAISWS